MGNAWNNALLNRKAKHPIQGDGSRIRQTPAADQRCRRDCGTCHGISSWNSGASQPMMRVTTWHDLTTNLTFPFTATLWLGMSCVILWLTLEGYVFLSWFVKVYVPWHIFGRFPQGIQLLSCDSLMQERLLARLVSRLEGFRSEGLALHQRHSSWERCEDGYLKCRNLQNVKVSWRIWLLALLLHMIIVSSCW